MFAFFTYTKYDDYRKEQFDDSWQDFLLNAFRCTAKQSTVWGAMYRWDLINFTKDLDVIRTGRDLKFRICAGRDARDDDNPKDIPYSIKLIFRNFESGGIFERNPDGMINHNKFFVFEKFKFSAFAKHYRALGVLPGDSPALYISSSNITENDNAKHNAFAIVPINVEIMRAFRDYYDDLESEYKKASGVSGWFNTNSNKDRYLKVSSDRVKVYFFPRRSGIDTMLGIVKNVKASPDGSPIVSGNSQIRIVVPRWFDKRKDIAMILAELNGGEPCRVDCQAITRCADKHVGDKVMSYLEKIKLHYFQNDEAKKNIHSKYLLINGYYETGGEYPKQELVWIGSANLSQGAIDNQWEVILKIKNEPLMYQAFDENFNKLKDGNATVDKCQR